ncbi:MAG TPA: acyltransferase family protein [Lentimicrobium sp.]|nr:acyltransferase family protein [Lentimicrobium sp.]
MSERINLPDLLKGIAVVLMVQVHLTELFIEDSFLSSQIGKLSLFFGGVPAAPLFMTVMGFFLLYIPKPVSLNLKRGIKLIFLGFMLNGGINLHLFVNIFFRGWAIDPLPYFFGVDILFLAGFSVIVISLLNKFFPNNAFLFFLLALIFSASSTIIPVYSGDSYCIRVPLAYIHSYDWWSYFPIIPWMAYPFAGASVALVIRKNRFVIEHHYKKPFLLIIPLAIVFVFWSFGYKVSSDLFSYYHHGVRFFIWAIMLLLVFTSLVYFLDNAVSNKNLMKRYLLWTGKNVTAFYVVQWLIIGNLATSLYKSQSPLVLPLWLIAVLAVSSLVVRFWRYIISQHLPNSNPKNH